MTTAPRIMDRRDRCRKVAVGGLILGLASFGPPAGQAEDAGDRAEPSYYSTAAPPVDYPGPGPVLLARSDPPAPAPAPAAPRARPARDPKLASVPSQAAAPRRPVARPAVARDPIAEAKAMIAASRVNFQQVQDYTCTFYKRERVDGRLTPMNVMAMKSRPSPLSVYFKFVRPNAGREAIYVEGQNKGKALVHDVGLGKLLAGTLALEPRSSMAMEDCRHPITEAGLGHLIQTIETGWAREMRAGETLVTIRHDLKVGDRPCSLIESKHPQPRAGDIYHMVRVYIDRENGLPIHFEAYDFPRQAGGPPILVEEYTYQNLRLNVGLSDEDFNPANRRYSFGRF